MYGAKLVKRTAMQQVISHLWKKRTECEVCIVDTVDVTKLREWLRNKRRETGKNYTLFHAFLTIALRLLKERGGMNRFVQDCALYEREEQTVSFVIKRQYRDDAEEALITLTGTPCLRSTCANHNTFWRERNAATPYASRICFPPVE